MNLIEIVAEMYRKPDPEYLLQWIENSAQNLDEAKTAIAAYYESLEEY